MYAYNTCECVYAVFLLCIMVSMAVPEECYAIQKVKY